MYSHLIFPVGGCHDALNVFLVTSCHKRINIIYDAQSSLVKIYPLMIYLLAHYVAIFTLLIMYILSPLFRNLVNRHSIKVLLMMIF